MTLYIAEVEVEDDPYQGEGTVIVEADDLKTALRLVREGARDVYNVNAGGWSHKPKVHVSSCKRLRTKPNTLVMGSVWSIR